MPGGSGIAGAACRPRPHPLISSGAMTRAPAGPARSTRSAAVSTEQTANTGHLSPRSSPDGYEGGGAGLDEDGGVGHGRALRGGVTRRNGPGHPRPDRGGETSGNDSYHELFWRADVRLRPWLSKSGSTSSGLGRAPPSAVTTRRSGGWTVA